MKILLLLLISMNLLANPNLSEIRKTYPTAANSDSEAKAFSLMLSGVTPQSSKTLLAYKGASKTLISKFAKPINEKISAFKDGANLIESAIEKEPNNIEIRLIRLSIQENVPAIVNYRKNKREDKDFLILHYQEQSGELREYIRKFLLSLKDLSEAEKNSLTK